MNTLAQELNTILSNTVVDSFMSDMGREMFFPKGIVAQSGEAKARAQRFNATVGMACKNKTPLIMPQLQEFIPNLNANEIVAYAPTAGIAGLRELWLDGIIEKNPLIERPAVSLPIVCSGLTHGISLCADLFADPQSAVVIPDFFWGNYTLIFEQRRNASIHLFPFFNDDNGFNIAALNAMLQQTSKTYKKTIVLLNFPNNPSGYSPTKDEARQIAELLQAHAQQGNKLLVLLDDAYFGFFYEDDTFPHSLFSLLYNADPNLLAIKVDGITKEDYAWGLRTGFITLGCKNFTAEQYGALQTKFMGFIRSSVSNGCNLSQNLIAKLLKDSSYPQAKHNIFLAMKERYKKVRNIINEYNKRENAPLQAIPFNSGYFMAFYCRNNNAEALRQSLLDQEIGVIAIQNHIIRIAFSSIDEESLEDLYAAVFSTADNLS